MFKALPPKSSFVRSHAGGDEEPPSETELTKIICDQITRAANAAKKDALPHAVSEEPSPDVEEAAEGHVPGPLSVEEKDIPVADAKRSTTVGIFSEEAGLGVLKFLMTVRLLYL